MCNREIVLVLFRNTHTHKVQSGIRPPLCGCESWFVRILTRPCGLDTNGMTNTEPFSVVYFVANSLALCVPPNCKPEESRTTAINSRRITLPMMPFRDVAGCWQRRHHAPGRRLVYPRPLVLSIVSLWRIRGKYG